MPALRLSVFAGLARTGTVFSYEKGAARCSPAHTRPRRSALPCPILTFSDKNEPEQLCALRFRAFCVLSALEKSFLPLMFPRFHVIRKDFALICCYAYMAIMAQTNHVFRLGSASHNRRDHMMPFQTIDRAAVCAAFFLVMRREEPVILVLP